MALKLKLRPTDWAVILYNLSITVFIFTARNKLDNWDYLMASHLIIMLLVWFIAWNKNIVETRLNRWVSLWYPIILILWFYPESGLLRHIVFPRDFDPELLLVETELFSAALLFHRSTFSFSFHTGILPRRLFQLLSTSLGARHDCPSPATPSRTRIYLCPDDSHVCAILDNNRFPFQRPHSAPRTCNTRRHHIHSAHESHLFHRGNRGGSLSQYPCGGGDCCYSIQLQDVSQGEPFHHTVAFSDPYFYCCVYFPLYD